MLVNKKNIACVILWSDPVQEIKQSHRELHMTGVMRWRTILLMWQMLTMHLNENTDWFIMYSTTADNKRKWERSAYHLKAIHKPRRSQYNGRCHIKMTFKFKVIQTYNNTLLQQENMYTAVVVWYTLQYCFFHL